MGKVDFEHGLAMAMVPTNTGTTINWATVLPRKGVSWNSVMLNFSAFTSWIGFFSFVVRTQSGIWIIWIL